MAVVACWFSKFLNCENQGLMAILELLKFYKPKKVKLKIFDEISLLVIYLVFVVLVRMHIVLLKNGHQSVLALMLKKPVCKNRLQANRFRAT